MHRWLGAQRRLARFELLMARGFDLSVRHLARQPRTLLHGDLEVRSHRRSGMGRGDADRRLGTGEAAALYRGLPGRVRATRARSVGPASVLTRPGPLSDHKDPADSLLVGGPYENLAFVDGVLEEMESACRYLDSEGSDD
jgi:hypothetical protein